MRGARAFHAAPLSTVHCPLSTINSPGVFHLKTKPKRRLPLFWRLMVTIMACWFALLAIAFGVTLHYGLRTFENKVDEILLSCNRTLAENPSIRDMVREGVCTPEMALFLDDVVEFTEDLDYITIADANSIRIYHIDRSYVGLPFLGGDQDRALAGETYLSDAVAGHFGEQRRAFQPIFDDDGTVIGFVMSSATHERIELLRTEIYRTYINLFLLLTVCTLAFSAWLAVYLARNLRGVRPEDLIRTYLTQSDMLNALDEGLVSFDNSGRVRLVNAAAARMLGQREDLLVGRHVDELLLDEKGGSLRQLEGHTLRTSRPNVLAQKVQLPNSNLWARQVLILADKSEVMRYAEELGGTRHMLQTLRANTHEFLNRLQVISGLLQMGRVNDALDYIGSIASDHEHGITPVMQCIHNPNVGALILAKGSNMRELDIGMSLMRNSSLPQRSRYLSTNELVTVVGNLLENAMEAVNAVPAEALRSIVLQITEDEKGLLIMVSDTGVGIEPEALPHIYENGFSTKAKSGRGVGMALIKDITDRHGGSIDVDTEPGSGTTISIIFSRERGGAV